MRLFKLLFRTFLRERGYTREQTVRLVGGLDWDTIRAAIRKYGPILLKIFLALLPLIIAQEAPAEIVQINDEEESEEWNYNYTEVIKDDV